MSFFWINRHRMASLYGDIGKFDCPHCGEQICSLSKEEGLDYIEVKVGRTLEEIDEADKISARKLLEEVKRVKSFWNDRIWIFNEHKMDAGPILAFWIGPDVISITILGFSIEFQLKKLKIK